MTIGYIMLAAGIALYIRLVLTGKGELWQSLMLLMGCLLFFNLPAVLNRRRDQKADSNTTEVPGHKDGERSNLQRAAK